MNIEDRLKSYKKKTATKSELGSLFGINNHIDLYHAITKAYAAGLLSPVKASGTDGNRMYPIYLKYRITAKNDYSETLADISLLHTSLTKNGYLSSKPELYEKYKTQLQMLNKYLFDGKSNVSVSKKERSFDIFGEEKQLDDSSFRGFLDRLGLTNKELCYYETPEYCFNDYIPERKAEMTLLILENKDIWFNIRRRMYEDGAHEIFGVHIDGAVCGWGNKISEIGALSQYTHFLGAEKIHYLYWGDIDRAGLNIYLSTLKNNPELDFKLFVPAYGEMIRLSENRAIPDSCDGREILGDYDKLYTLFPVDDKNILMRLIADNKRLPQEIINYETLLNVMR